MMGHKVSVALRATNAVLLLIIAILVAVAKEVRVTKPKAWRFAMSGFSIGIDSWSGYKEGYALYFNSSPRGQFFVFFMALILMVVSIAMAVFALIRGIRWKSSIVEIVLLTISVISSLLMFGVECWYASCWNWRTKQFTSSCMVQSWAAAAAFLVLSCLVFIVDLILSVKSLHNPQENGKSDSDYTPGTKISLPDTKQAPDSPASTLPSKDAPDIITSSNTNNIAKSPMNDSNGSKTYTATYATNISSNGLNRVQIAQAASRMTDATSHYITNNNQYHTQVHSSYARSATEV